MKYFVDFDSTICPHGMTENGPPSKECLEVLNRIKECNNEIFIYSCRANEKCVYDKEACVDDMIKYLIRYNVPYDGIIHDKPYWNYFIDDRNVGTPLDSSGNVDWAKIKPLIEKELDPKQWKQ
jgi:hypothetical protein